MHIIAFLVREPEEPNVGVVKVVVIVLRLEQIQQILQAELERLLVFLVGETALDGMHREEALLLL